MTADRASQGVTPSLDRRVRVRKDTVSRKIGNCGAEPCFFIFVGFTTAISWVRGPLLS
jgi:hypothetical protein